MRQLAMLCLVALTLSVARPAQADKLCGAVPDVMIVLDRSGTMKENTAGGQSKWKAAKGAIDLMLKDFSGHIAFGLMLFSRWDNGPVSHCKTGMVNVDPSPNAASAITNVLNKSYPSGDTPATNSLNAARDYLSNTRQAGKAQYVILITDGKETCSPNWPDSATDDLLADGVKTFVVGFDVGAHQRPDKLDAAAKAGGTGTYYKADNPTTLTATLKTIAGAISCCGNGQIDAGERCDTGILSGQGRCPTSCNDNRADTKDDLLSPGTCNARCNHTVIAPPPLCGNGILDPNEQCDTAIARGKQGYCPRSPADCNDNDTCTRDSVFSSSCNAVCVNARTCPIDPCGNGSVDQGETCDTGIAKGYPGYCARHPSECDDGNPNTADFLTGAGCKVRCDNRPTATNPVCGNGTVDGGEWCDTAIPAGKAGACPRDCNDGNPCTVDTLMGQGCLAYCSNTQINTPAHGDGCCPAGATGATDSDCGAACGNGVLEPGEKCDPGLAAGKPGACPKSCPDDNNPCTTIIMGGGPCTPQCVTNMRPPNLTHRDGCCPKGMTDAQDADCLPPCTPDRTVNCTDACLEVTCPDGEYCQGGSCVPWPGNVDPTTGGAATGVAGGCDCEVGTDSTPLNALPLILFGLFVVFRRKGSRS